MLSSLAVFAATAAAAAEKKSGLPQLNQPDFAPQLVWLALTFVVLYILLKKLALPRVGEVIQERRDRIQRDIGEAERLKGETDKAIAGYEQALNQARTNAAAIVKENRDRLMSEVDAERAKVEQQAAAKLAEAEQRIAGMKSNALAQVSSVAAETAGAVVAKLTGQSVGADEIRRAMAPGAGE